ncbi:hypothetical protein O3M35_000424 [Rhynocoris fuscipes]|uniref:Uncharacterized protein n=1 Tax=Rhynocoris fuscipes TaxID=488301 RepID=A0AAW1DME1_9HEMI
MNATESGGQEITWDWISKDERIKKKILVKGWWNGARPFDGTSCALKIDVDDFGDFDVAKEIRMPSINHFFYTVGEGETIFERMLDRLLLTMNVHEECLVEYLVDDLVYSAKIKLLQFECSVANYALDAEKKFEKAKNIKERGVELFKEGRVLDAYYRFKKAAQLLIFLDRNQEQYLPTYLIVCNNLAQCHLQLGNYEHVLTLCSKVLEKEPLNVKCLLRRAAALENLKDFEKALDEYKKILQIESNNQRALERYQIVKKEVDSMNERYNQAVKRMFNFT